MIIHRVSIFGSPFKFDFKSKREANRFAKYITDRNGVVDVFPTAPKTFANADEAIEKVKSLMED